MFASLAVRASWTCVRVVCAAGISAMSHADLMQSLWDMTEMGRFLCEQAHTDMGELDEANPNPTELGQKVNINNSF